MNYGVFIISHGRADNQLTLNALRKCGYNDGVFIVIDNLDEQKDLYLEKYDNVLVFDKEEYYNKSDSMDNFHILSSALYARNFCLDKAKELGLDYIVLLDDDLKSFNMRYNNDGKLSKKEIKDINKIFLSFIEYMEDAGITCTSFGNEGGFIGGIHGKWGTGYGRTCCAALIIKVNDGIRYLGTQNEDYNISVKYWDKIFMELYRVSFLTSKRGENDGGNNYDISGLYCSNFYSIMINPSFNKIAYHDNKITLKRKWNSYVPMIISERWKK